MSHPQAKLATLARAAAAEDVFGNNDRLGVSTFGAFLVHMVVILGVTFAAPKLREIHGLPTLEITLVQTQSDRLTKEAELLAQANQDGGGDSDKADIARNPLPIREISDSTESLPSAQSLPQPWLQSKQEKTDLLANRSKHKLSEQEPQPEKLDPQLAPPSVGINNRVDAQQERARLNAEISRFWQEYQKRPKHKYLNARTREYKYAAYMDAWRAKVERIGNLNYPEAARRRELSGNLVLDVVINPDGTILEVKVRRSSGHKLLDDAAVRIVELAAPFPPFPPEIRQEADILHITRTWKFNERLTSGEF